jgi:Fe-S cluster biosynthesis and repair protein YggX
VQFGMPFQQAKRVRVYLSGQPIHKWPGELQDVLFNEVIERGGWRHWSLGGSPCNALIP